MPGRGGRDRIALPLIGKESIRTAGRNLGGHSVVVLNARGRTSAAQTRYGAYDLKVWVNLSEAGCRRDIQPWIAWRLDLVRANAPTFGRELIARNRACVSILAGVLEVRPCRANGCLQRDRSIQSFQNAGCRATERLVLHGPGDADAAAATR